MVRTVRIAHANAKAALCQDTELSKGRDANVVLFEPRHACDILTDLVVMTEYLEHRKALEERRATFRRCLAVLIISMSAIAAITNSWIAHARGQNRPIKNTAPTGCMGVIAVRDVFRESPCLVSPNGQLGHALNLPDKQAKTNRCEQ
jgi:hypothetical protein